MRGSSQKTPRLQGAARKPQYARFRQFMLAAWGPPFSKVDLLEASDGTLRHELNEPMTDVTSVSSATRP